MYLTHQEKEKMLLLFAAIVAKSRKEKGLKLSYPEAVAYLSGHIIEGAREGKTVQQLIEECNQLLTNEDVMPGVPELITELQVEAMFVDGTKLVSLNSPIPSAASATLPPGAYAYAAEDIILSKGRKRVEITVVNTADRPVQVGSHFHFYEVNPALVFDRELTKGYHLDIASGLSIRFMPGVQETISLVEYGGDKIIHGFTGKINGSI
ncbi:urease subunit gamma [Myroides sp. WP-1]|uniref:urease subunit gamma n=1 Tax=Myroides sp. WP-1 TaxID=2759944 RepID=UPI0015FCE94E|nr:urease subunit gamma [Myroides sp. WP-1]MBB1140705.1 urease subunit gamma [Myroides sp. WP-1]